jgi:uncharacterized RDD family membrane protein YckC
MVLPDAKNYIGKRIAATLIDYTLVFGLTIAYVSIFGSPNDEGGRTISGLPALVPLIFWFAYFIVTENLLDGTLGHQLMGLIVVTLDNKHPAFSQTVVRRVADALEISWCFGFIAFIIVYRTDHCQRLGDILAKTIVVKKNAFFTDPTLDIENKAGNAG